MLRVVILAASAVALAGLSFVLFSGADSQIQPKALVVLQPTTPGTPQAGHSNLNGTSRAGQFVGGGAGLTDVVASGLDLPLSWSGNLATADGLSISVAGSTGANRAIQASLTTTNGSASAIFAQAIGEGYGVQAQGVRAGVLGSTTTTNGYGVFGFHGAPTGDGIAVYGSAVSPNGTGVYGISDGTGVVGYGGAIGVLGTGGNATIGVKGESGFNDGVQGVVGGPSNGAAGVRGRATASSGLTNGVHGESSSTSGTGVFGNTPAGTGETYGVQGRSSSTAGTGVSGYTSAATGATFGVKGQSNSNAGIGVYGLNTRTSGFTFGGIFQSDSTDGIGVFGHATRTSGANYGVYGDARSTTGVGVYGQVPATGTGVGVWGRGESATGWGVYANGRLGASGGKSFRIDHPLDPENKWLLHYCSEGPEPLNVYSGSITTDAQGFATIHLPDYFEEINRDPRVQLTVDDSSDDFVMAKVVGGVNAATCRIRTSKPNVKVYWEVKAVRNDRWMQKHGAPVEQDKGEHEIGKYQHPELYGLPAEMGIARRDVRGQ